MHLVWPNTLVQCALFNTLHSQTYAGIGKHEGLSRERFFVYAFAGAICWYFVPGYLFTALRYANLYWIHTLLSLTRVSPLNTVFSVGYAHMISYLLKDLHLFTKCQVCWIVPNNVVSIQTYGIMTISFNPPSTSHRRLIRCLGEQ